MNEFSNKSKVDFHVNVSKKTDTAVTTINSMPGKEINLFVCNISKEAQFEDVKHAYKATYVHFFSYDREHREHKGVALLKFGLHSEAVHVWRKKKELSLKGNQMKL